MSEQPDPNLDVIRPEVEILPPGHSEPGPAAAGPQIWLSVDSRGGTRRVYIAKPGPITSALVMLAFGALLAMTFVAAFALFAVLVTISAVALAGLLIYGVVRWAFMRLR